MELVDQKTAYSMPSMQIKFHIVATMGRQASMQGLTELSERQPHAFVQCNTSCTGKLKKCRGLPPTILQLMGAEGSAPRESEGAVEPCRLRKQ